MSPFVEFCNRITPLTNAANDDLEAGLKSKYFIKKDFILHQGTPCRNLYFLESGLVKMFCYADSKEFIMNFFQEGSIFTVLDSFPFQSPSEYNAIALEDSSVQYLSYSTLEELSKKHHCIETLYRKILLHASDKMMRRIREMLIQSHSEHYHHYLEHNSQLVQRLSLGDLACYLGITQVSLSRIRSKK